MRPTPEVRILLLTAKWSVQSEDRDRLAELVRGAPDWDKVIALAHEHGVEGLLYKRLEGLEVPDEILRRLRAGYAETWARTLAAKTSLPEVFDAFERAEIPLVLLKGIALIDTIYEDPGLRPLTDVDVLIHPEKFDKARAVLSAVGFESWEDHEDHMERGPLVLELHTSASGSDRIGGRRFAAHLSTESIWERALPRRGDPPQVLYPSPEDHFLYLCRHLLKHSYEGLIWFTDLAGFIHKHQEDLDWKILFHRAREASLESTLIFVLRFLDQVLGEPLPPPVVAEITKTPSGRMERSMLERLGHRLEVGPVANFILLGTIRGYSDRLSFFWESCFPQHDIMRQIYPSYRPNLRAWYCALRTFQLIGLGVATAVRLLLPIRKQRPMQGI